MSDLSVKERLDKLDLIELKLGEGINELKELRFDGISENIDHVTCSAEETRMAFANDSVNMAVEEYLEFILHDLQQIRYWLERLI